MDTRERDRDGESPPTLAALLSALRNHAAATGRARLAHLCSAGLHAGDFAAVARVVAAIDGIDTSPTRMPADDDGDDLASSLGSSSPRGAREACADVGVGRIGRAHEGR